jgi:hypothetical protein
MLDDPSRLRSDEYQVYAILTMCRMFYTLEHGEVVSKPTAAHWVMESLDPRWSALIEQALTWRPGLVFDHFEETLDFIRYALDRSNACHSELLSKAQAGNESPYHRLSS